MEAWLSLMAVNHIYVQFLCHIDGPFGQLLCAFAPRDVLCAFAPHDVFNFNANYVLLFLSLLWSSSFSLPTPILITSLFLVNLGLAFWTYLGQMGFFLDFLLSSIIYLIVSIFYIYGHELRSPCLYLTTDVQDLCKSSLNPVFPWKIATTCSILSNLLAIAIIHLYLLRASTLHVNMESTCSLQYFKCPT